MSMDVTQKTEAEVLRDADAAWDSLFENATNGTYAGAYVFRPRNWRPQS